MCPSYMVTLEDKHSTRGRANLMRESSQARLPAGRVHRQRTVRCAGSLSGVQRLQGGMSVERGHGEAEIRIPGPLQRSQRRLIRSRMFANIHNLSRIASAFPTLANWTMKQPSVRRSPRSLCRNRCPPKPSPICARKRSNPWFANPPAIHNPRSAIHNPRRRSLPRHLHQLQLSGDRHRSHSTSRSCRLRSSDLRNAGAAAGR